jgi:hypothetical protein
MRKNTSINKSFYHYCVEEYDQHETLISKKHYLTLTELEHTYKKSRFTFNKLLNNEKIKSLPNIKLKKVHIPVYNIVPNNINI